MRRLSVQSSNRLTASTGGNCPLDDDQLIQAAAVGLLPLWEGRKLVWIIAPRDLTARYLADPRQSLPSELSSFRLTSSEQLSRFVARHSQKAIARRAANRASTLKAIALERATAAWHWAPGGW